jgi:hypothetical protein
MARRVKGKCEMTGEKIDPTILKRYKTQTGQTLEALITKKSRGGIQRNGVQPGCIDYLRGSCRIELRAAFAGAVLADASR